jgi:hypothetical protein
LGYNKALTGDALLTPFNKWAPNDRLGFGNDLGMGYWCKEDRSHSLWKAVFRDSFFSLNALGSYLIGWGHISLVLLLWPLIRSRWRKRAWALAVPIGSLVIAYWFYHASSVIAGQARYWSESMPMMMLLVAVALSGVWRRLPRLCRLMDMRPAARTGRAACWMAVLMLTAWSVPRAYQPLTEAESFMDTWGQQQILRVRDLAEKTKLENAVVFIRAFHYRQFLQHQKGDIYAFAFVLNDLDLQGPVVYARDLGERNAELMAKYPNRTAYRFVRGYDEDEDRFQRISLPASK